MRAARGWVGEKGFMTGCWLTCAARSAAWRLSEQIVDAVPVGPLDIRLNCILTPTRWIET